MTAVTTYHSKVANAEAIRRYLSWLWACSVITQLNKPCCHVSFSKVMNNPWKSWQCMIQSKYAKLTWSTHKYVFFIRSFHDHTIICRTDPDCTSSLPPSTDPPCPTGWWLTRGTYSPGIGCCPTRWPARSCTSPRPGVSGILTSPWNLDCSSFWPPWFFF